MKLSEARRTLQAMIPNPMKRLAEDWPYVQVKVVEMGDQWEQIRWEHYGPVLLLNQNLHDVQARVAVTHACEHLDRGEGCEPLRWQIEHFVQNATARWLIPDIDQLGAALAVYGNDLAKVAWEFWVPPFIVSDRIRALTDDEQLRIHKHQEEVA